MEQTDLNSRRGRHNSPSCGLDGGFEPLLAMAAIPGLDGRPQEFARWVAGRGEGRVLRALNPSVFAVSDAPRALRLVLAPAW